MLDNGYKTSRYPVRHYMGNGTLPALSTFTAMSIVKSNAMEEVKYGCGNVWLLYNRKQT